MKPKLTLDTIAGAILLLVLGCAGLFKLGSTIITAVATGTIPGKAGSVISFPSLPFFVIFLCLLIGVVLSALCVHIGFDWLRNRQ